MKQRHKTSPQVTTETKVTTEAIGFRVSTQLKTQIRILAAQNNQNITEFLTQLINQTIIKQKA